MTTQQVERRHREAALACEFEFPETEGAFSSWVRTGEWDFHPTLGLRKRLERVAQALANAEQPAPSAPAEFATANVLEVGTAPNGQVEVTLTCSPAEARKWARLLYTRIRVGLTDSPKGKEGANG